MTGTAHCFIGFPGAGKSTAAKLAQLELDTPIIISTGDIVRRLAAEFHDCPLEELTGREIGEFSTFKRESAGPCYVAKEVQHLLETEYADEWPDYPLVLEGVRDSEAASYYNEFIEDFRVIFVHAPFDQRLTRLAMRGREADEGGMNAESLVNREKRELSWGMDTFPEEAGQVVMNTGDLESLQSKMQEVVA